MDMKKLLVGTLVGGLVSWLLGFLIYGLLLMDYFQGEASAAAADIWRDPPEMLWLVLGSLFQGCFITYIFTKWAGISTFSGGLQAGAVIGLLLGLAFNLTWHGVADLQTLSATFVDVLLAIVTWSILGGIVGAVLGMLGGKK